ncbi:hypothetical protein O9992_27670 [Vibrio lentus]|nr:hypothetical protein [Vibrio lentus]
MIFWLATATSAFWLGYFASSCNAGNFGSRSIDLVLCHVDLIVEYGISVRHFKHLIDILRWCINGLLNAIGLPSPTLKLMRTFETNKATAVAKLFFIIVLP